MEINKLYTFSELKELKGEEFISKFGKGIPLKINKKIIEKFEDFSEEEKKIYISIYYFIASKNTDKQFVLYATGSRIKGYWRTKKESEDLSAEYELPCKESDYDIITDAKIKPTKEEFMEALNIKIDYNNNNDKKVLIIA